MTCVEHVPFHEVERSARVSKVRASAYAPGAETVPVDEPAEAKAAPVNEMSDVEAPEKKKHCRRFQWTLPRGRQEKK